jgi:hypothetical protein
MDAKLTLKLDKNVIEKAKIYAAQQELSLSKIIESYFQALTSKEKRDGIEETKISSLVKSLSIGKGEIPADFDYKKDRQNHLIEKHK